MRNQDDHLPDEWLLRYLDGELDNGFDAHLRVCGECRGRIGRMRHVSDAIAEYGTSLTDSRRGGKQRHSLIEAIRSGEAAVEKSRTSGRGRAVAAVLAIAATVVLALVFRPAPAPSTPVGGVRGAATDANGFIALPYSDENLAPEGAVVLEVEVPRSALLLAGIPSGESGSTDRVKAEVMVGADGLARAIRFVN